MGFYGNITNTSRTQFQFDTIYPNRVEMERAKLTDSIYLGRHVLIEYDSNYHRDSYFRVWFNKAGDPTTAYSSETYESNTSLKNSDAEENPIVIVYGEKEDKFYAWQKPEEYDPDEDGIKIAKYDEIVGGNDLLYTINYTIDLNAYKAARGYDSTVWQKVYSEDSERYVMIAELNTVVPTFAISADAPTLSPITPHFDTRSTDVYYKLHWQAPWGFRMAAAEKGNTTNNQSDLMTSWERESYDPNTGATTKEYYFSDEERWRALDDGESIPELNAAIYFNQAGFNEYSRSYIDNIDSATNQIKITASGKSGQNYNKHDGSIDMEPKIDTQEMIINLPGIGNMMSKAWDIIHGDDRRDSTGDDHPSLQGRLNAFSAMQDNTIAIKRSSDGTLVGTQINGNTSRTVSDVLNETLHTTDYDKDDAWIQTSINTVGLDNQNDLKGIAIHHTFHATASSVSSLNKNTGVTTTSDKYKEEKLPVFLDADDNVKTNAVNADTGTNDIVKFYTPYVDAAGHIVGHNIEAVTLPYGYKTFTGENGTTTSAKSTQDTMSVIGDNNWVQTTVSNDNIAIAHIGPVAVTATKVDDVTPNFGETFTITDWYFDNKGHKSSSNTHTVKIPKPSLTNGTGNVVTQIALTDATTGAFTETRANVGTLAMTGYAKPTTLSNQALLATESLNTALGKLEYRLEKEVSDRAKAINDLDYSDAAVADNYVSEVSEVDGVISVKRVALPTLQTGTANGTVKLSNGINVNVYGLKSAAYTESSAYATAAQGAKADGAIQETNKFKCGEEEKTVAELFELVASLQEELIQLKAKVEVEHPTTQLEPETTE